MSACQERLHETFSKNETVTYMKRIAVFCALPPDRNTGMATVDLAAMSVIKRIAPDAEITLYAYGKPTHLTYQPGDLPYQYLNVEEHTEKYLSSDVFVFWGDFTHARSYWTIDRAYPHTTLGNVSEADAAKWNMAQFIRASQYIFLTALPPSRLKNVVVFGSTIITNDTADELDEVYYKPFVTFFTNIRTVLFRDALSAARISPLRSSEATLGCDCALLLQDGDLMQIAGFVPAAERKGVGVFFGRSPSKTKMMIFSRVVASHVGEKCSWLPWFKWYPPGRNYQLKSWILGFKLRPDDVDTGKLLSSLTGYKYIITDTYHLCVNAWRMGIPAICIGEGAGAAHTSLNDKKKETLYDMYGAREFYVFRETIGSLNSIKSIRRFMEAAKRAAKVLQSDSLVSRVFDNLLMHRNTAERRLREAIQGALDDT